MVIKQRLLENVIDLLAYYCREYHEHHNSKPQNVDQDSLPTFSAKRDLWELNHTINQDNLSRVANLLKASAFLEEEITGILYRLQDIERNFAGGEVDSHLAEIWAELAEE